MEIAEVRQKAAEVIQADPQEADLPAVEAVHLQKREAEENNITNN